MILALYTLGISAIVVLLVLLDILQDLYPPIAWVSLHLLWVAGVLWSGWYLWSHFSP